MLAVYAYLKRAQNREFRPGTEAIAILQNHTRVRMRGETVPLPTLLLEWDRTRSLVQERGNQIEKLLTDALIIILTFIVTLNCELAI